MSDDFKALRSAAHHLVVLMDNPEPGLATWNEFVRNNLQQLQRLIGHSLHQDSATAYSTALEIIHKQRMAGDMMRELLLVVLSEVETECVCDASRDKCLHCRIVECLEGKV